MIELAGKCTDFLSKSAALHVAAGATNRTRFDPTNVEHLRSLRHFIDTGSWGAVHFYVEVPYTTVPDTVMRKMVNHALEQVNI